MNISQLQRLLEPLRRKVLGMFGRAQITASNDAKGRQLLDLDIATGGGPVPKVERLQEYGFTSRPLDGAEAAVIFLGANREAGLIIATEDARYRLKSLEKGEVALYTDEGDKIHFKRGRKIEITTQTLKIDAATKVEVNSPTVQVVCETATVEADNATVEASVQATIEAPLVNITAATSVNADTPLLNVTGLIACAGLAAGGGIPEAGKAKISGDIEAGGDVKDATGTMEEMRTTYNGHTHPENGPGGGTTSPPNQAM